MSIIKHKFNLITKLQRRYSDEPTGRLALVFELMEMNFYEAIKGNRRLLNFSIGRPNYLPEARVKHYMYQLLKAIEHMHRNGIFHRDIKP
jgi:renal tumor antigen